MSPACVFAKKDIHGGHLVVERAVHTEFGC